ncbi:MAG: hypothetical protein Q4B66_01270 [Ligilactobacillus agilis]|nr:hypothetical protein [Ligilactobacillus agilis]
MKKKGWIITIIILVVVACGGYLAYAMHAVSGKVPGHVYEYQGVNRQGTVYVAFSENSDKAVLTHSRDQALKADQDATSFDQIYSETSKQGKWSYKASGSHLTLALVNGNSTSQWQYNKVMVLGKKIYAPSFTYQINNAGQGVGKKMTSFTQIDQ